MKRFDLKGIFLTPTQNGFLQFFRYIFVGGAATLVDWGLLYILTDFVHIYHLVSAVIAFLLGLITNYFLSKALVFNANETRVKPLMEFLIYAVIGVVGLGITELIMFIFTDRISLHYMLSKVIATIIVLVWNFIARKKILYKSL